MAESAGVAATSTGDDIEDFKQVRARRARACVQELEGVASRYREFARYLRRPIRDLMTEAGRTSASDRDRILEAVEHSCHSYAEIVEFTNLPYSTVYRLVHKQPLSLLLDFTKSPPIVEPGRGGRRRPETLIFFKRIPL